MQTIITGNTPLAFHTAVFLSQGHEKTLLVCDDPALCRQFAETTGHIAIQGDGGYPSILAQAKPRKEDVLVAVATHEEHCFVFCEVAHRLFGLRTLFAVAPGIQNGELFQSHGIQCISPDVMGWEQLIRERIHTNSSMHSVSLDANQCFLVDMTIGEQDRMVGKPAASYPFPQGSILAGILRKEGTLTNNPADVLYPGDHLMLLTRRG